MKTGKRTAALMLAAIFLLGVLTGCGAAESAESEQPELGNALDHSRPIPPDSGTLTLTEQTFDIPQLTLACTGDMQAAADGDGVTVTSGDGVWTIAFQPFVRTHRTNLVNDLTNYYVSAGVEVFPDRDEAETTLAGFPATVYSRNIAESWINPEEPYMVPSVDIILDYGSTLVGEWAGLHVRLTSNDYENYGNIYDVLKLDPVLAVLNHFRINEGDRGVAASGAGITVNFPSSWDCREDPFGPWAGIFESSSLVGALYFKPATPADPAEAAALHSEELFDWECGDRSFKGAVVNCALSGDSVDYQLHLYGEYSNDRSLSVILSLFDGKEDPQVLKDYIETDTFRNVIRSLQLDPAGIPNLASSVDDSGLIRNDRGIITGYEGTDREVVIPAVISGVEITGIGYTAFAGNKDIKKVTLPETVQYIDEYAFRDCSSLETLEFGSVQSIGYKAFEGCTALRDVVLPETVTYVDNSVFCEVGQGSFTAQGAAKYGTEAFYGSTFDTITIGSGSDLSAGGIFFLSHASEIQLGDGIRTIGDNCFNSMAELKTLKLPDSVTAIGANSLAWTGLQEIRIPEGVTEIPEGALVTESALIVLPESVTKIAGLAVKGQTVVLQNPDVELGECAVTADFLLLPKVYGEADVRFEMDDFYLDVRKQIMIAMDASPAESSAFDDYLEACGLGRISWYGVDTDLMTCDPEAFDYDGDTVKGYSGKASDFCIPFFNGEESAYICVVGKKAFAGSGVRSVVLHSYIEEIRADAFQNCSQLEELWFTSFIAKAADPEFFAFDKDAFAGIPDGVTVHIPACLTGEERGAAEEVLRAAGLPETAVFDYYSLR